jgi:hypothetical protein
MGKPIRSRTAPQTAIFTARSPGACVSHSELSQYAPNYNRRPVDKIIGAWGFVRAFEYESGATRAPTVVVEDDFGPYRLTYGKAPAWPPIDRAYGGPVYTVWRQAAPWVIRVINLIVPVTLLVVLLGATYLYADAVLAFGKISVPIGVPLLGSDLVLPVACFSIHLTNRRYGATYALAQLTAALAVCMAVVLQNPFDIGTWVPSLPALTNRTMISFGIAFFLANLIGIAFFEETRGPHWWVSPLIGSIATSLVFTIIYYPSALAGIYERWAESAYVHFIMFFAESILLLIPYWLLRATMRPLHGLNGY